MRRGAPRATVNGRRPSGQAHAGRRGVPGGDLQAAARRRAAHGAAPRRRAERVAAVACPRCSARLRAAGLVERPPRRASRSRPQGEVEGARLVRRHRLSERFLVDYLGMPWDAVHDEACKFEHVLSPEVEARLAEQLGDPRTCPHGHVIPDEDGSLDRRASCGRCRSSSAGDAGVIGCITEESGDLLRYLGVARSAARHAASRSRASRRSAARCSCASPARSTRSAARWPARSWSGPDGQRRRLPSAHAGGGSRGRRPSDRLVICLAGNPNVGKSSLFNALTGAACETANCAGVTTEATAACACVGRAPRRGRRPARHLRARGARRRPARGARRAARAPPGRGRRRRRRHQPRPQSLPAAAAARPGLSRRAWPLNLVDEARAPRRSRRRRRAQPRAGRPRRPHRGAARRGPATSCATIALRRRRVAATALGRGRRHAAAAATSRTASTALAAAIADAAAARPFGLSSRAAALAVLEGDAELAAALGRGRRRRAHDRRRHARR